MIGSNANWNQKQETKIQFTQNWNNPNCFLLVLIANLTNVIFGHL